jgi:adenylate kinase family enzyme
MNPHLKEIFSQAYILGGSPCSGKSTIAEMLAAQYDLCYYKADDHDPEHMQQAKPEQQPVMFKYARIGWDEIWSQSVETLLTDELAYYRERFPFVLNDLSQITDDRPLLLEGVAFLPDLIHRYNVNPKNVIFMVPTFEFQIQHYSQRPWIQSILSECHDPKQAFENWMQRDHLFGLEVIRQAEEHGYHVILVDGSADIQAQFETVGTRFNL